MNRRTLVALALGFTLAVTACHKNPPPAAAPTPTPGPATPPPPPPPPPPTPVRNTTDNTAAIEKAVTGRMATIGDRIHFDYNVSDLKPEDVTRLDAKAALLKQFGQLKLRITGHADERGSDQYNIALGMRRAAAAKEYLVKVGIDGARIETASLGREVPLDPGHDEAAWAQNRRDEFDIIAGSQSLRVP
jgi:peptidoglycan-associated lipoprotein